MYKVERDRGARARENRGVKGYGRRERKGREARVLRGRKVGEKYKALTFVTGIIHYCFIILSET